MESNYSDRYSVESSSRGRGKNKRFWNVFEDDVLIQALHELSTDLRWKSENGFKNGYISRLEEMVNEKLPNSGIKAIPHIESRLKHWYEKYSAMSEMLATSGFGWDHEKKLLQVDKSVYDEWVKVHKKAKGLYGVPFPQYETLAEIYGKDRATGDAAETFVDVINNLGNEMANEAINVDNIGDDDDIASVNISISE